MERNVDLLLKDVPLMVGDQANKMLEEGGYQSIADFDLDVNSISSWIGSVIKAVYREEGGSDPFFESLYRNLVVSVSTILMAGMPYSDENREPNLVDLRDILTKFEKIDPYLKVVKERYGEGEDNPFYHAMCFVETEMRSDSKKAKKLWEYTRGFRDMLDKLLDTPDISELLCRINDSLFISWVGLKKN